MQLRSGRVWQWTVGVGLGAGLGAGLGLMASAQSPSVPDAPTPQTLPRLNTITPTAPAVPNAPAPQTPAPVKDTANDGVAAGTTLPASPASATQVPAENEDDNAAPISHIGSTIVVPVNFVQVPFTVKDSKGQLVPGLTYRDVQIYESGLRQHISLFTVDPIPLSVAIVIDQSVTFDTMRKIYASLSALQGAFTPYDEVSVFTYNNGVNEQTAFTGAQSARLTFALERSKAPGREPNMAMGGPLDQTTVKNNMPVDAQTNRGSAPGVILQTPEREFHTLNDAILTAGQTVAKAGKRRRRVIYVISDGKEYGSTAKTKQVIRFLQENQISVYATLVGDSSVPGVNFLDRIHLPLTMRGDVLPAYTTATGGDYDGAFRPRGIQDSFAKLAEQVRTQYTIGYYSHGSMLDERFRPWDVRVMRPSLEVVAPKGYYPRPQNAAPGRPTANAAAAGGGAGAPQN